MDDIIEHASDPDDPSGSEIPSTSTTTSTSQDYKNPISQYFDYKNDSRTCNVCKAKISAKTGTTTGAINHLKRKHIQAYKEYETKKQKWEESKKEKLSHDKPKPRQLSMQQAFELKSKWPHNHPQAIAVTKDITKFVVGGLHSYQIVEEKGFKNLINHAYPKYQVPSRTTFSRRIIPELYENTIKQIKANIGQTEYESFSFTTDGWTSKKTNNYLSLTGHFLNTNFELKAYCLGLREMTEQHTALNIRNALTEMLGEWALNDLTIPIYAVTDNAANMRSSINLSRWTHVACFGHLLQLAVQDGIKESVQVSHLMARCRTIVGHYSRSGVATARLHSQQKSLGEDVLDLIQDVSTRWNSQYFMLERLYRCRKSVSAELSSSDTSVETLKGTDWKLAEEVIKVFAPLVEATTFSSGEVYPTLSAVLPMARGMELKLQLMIDQEKISFAEIVKKQLRTRLLPLALDSTYQLATLVDPRYKLQGLNPDNKNSAILYLKQEARKLFNLSQGPLPATTSSSAEPGTSSIFTFLSQPGSSDQPSLSEDDVDSEVNRYLKVPILNHTEDPLSWWKVNHLNFPRVAKVALKYLGIPATSVPSERLFSTAGNVVVARRKQLIPEHVRQLVLLHDNLERVD